MSTVRGQTATVEEHIYTAVFEPAEGGGYVVSFPAIPGIATQGETLEEARDMAADLLRATLRSSARTADRYQQAACGATTPCRSR